ncbi:MAG: hypothetical protein GWP18_00780 [Proteobacteria bacterium]|nr:hypothetical protein [Pseudomonadota bacterium]
MTAHELTIALFWMVVTGYVTYVGWSIYSALLRIKERRRARSEVTDLADRKVSPAHPVIATIEAEWSRTSDEDRLAG